MLFIDNDTELGRILDSTNLDKHKLIDLAMYMYNLVTRCTNIRASESLGLAPCEGNSMELRSGIDSSQGSSASLPFAIAACSSVQIRVWLCVIIHYVYFYLQFF